jgi:hypothetical protein
MTAKQLQSAIKKRPFVPFVIRTKGGEEYTVGHPETIWQARPPEEDTIIVQDKKEGVVFTDVSCISEIVFSRSKSS